MSDLSFPESAALIPQAKSLRLRGDGNDLSEHHTPSESRNQAYPFAMHHLMRHRNFNN